MRECDREMREVEWLRPLVSSKSWDLVKQRSRSWDYCVVWKLGDGSTRSIEWMGCCCGGAEDAQDDGDNHLVKPCKDVVFQHPRRTNACEAIAKLPTSISINSGIYGQVLISGKPRWFTPSSKCSSGEKVGTRVLVPFLGYLIELFVARHVPKDQKIFDFLMALYNISFEQDTMKLNLKINKCLLEQQPLQGFMSSCPPQVEYPNENSIQHYLSLGTQHNFDLFFEGSSTGSISLNSPSSLDSGFNCGSKNSLALEQSSGIMDDTLYRQDLDLISNCGDLVEEEEENLKVFRSGEGVHKSKNLIAERKRRHKLKDRIHLLRSLVPKITKMDILSTLGDAISFILELQKEVKDLQNELKYMEEEDNYYNNSNILQIMPTYEVVTSEKIKTKDHEVMQLSHGELDSSSVDMKPEMEVQVEVYQIGVKEFVLKLFCDKRRDGFGRLMETIYSLGLKVTNANVTTFGEMVLNILILEADNEGVQVQEVKNSLFDLIHGDRKLSF